MSAPVVPADPPVAVLPRDGANPWSEVASPRTLELLDEEVRRTVDLAYEEVLALLTAERSRSLAAEVESVAAGDDPLAALEADLATLEADMVAADGEASRLAAALEGLRDRFAGGRPLLADFRSRSPFVSERDGYVLYKHPPLYSIRDLAFWFLRRGVRVTGP